MFSAAAKNTLPNIEKISINKSIPNELLNENRSLAKLDPNDSNPREKEQINIGKIDTLLENLIFSGSIQQKGPKNLFPQYL